MQYIDIDMIQSMDGWLSLEELKNIWLIQQQLTELLELGKYMSDWIRF